MTQLEIPQQIQERRELPDVFGYEDYRQYLKDVIEAKKRRQKGYTLARFASALGFSSHSGLAMVLTGQRELRPPYIDRCIKLLGLTLRQQLYFEAMVRADGLSTAKRKALLQEIENRATQWEPPVAQDGVRLIDFFVVQQILCLYRGYVPLETLLKSFRYRVTSEEVKAVLQWMIKRGIAERSPLGFRINQSVLMVKDEVPNASAKQFHKDCMVLAAAALESDPVERREFQTYLLTVDSQRIPELKRFLKKQALDTIANFESELDGDTVVQIHMNLFEVTERVYQGARREH